MKWVNFSEGIAEALLGMKEGNNLDCEEYNNVKNDIYITLLGW